MTAPAASLTASLLARKGEALPAMKAASFTDPSLAWDDAAPYAPATLPPPLLTPSPAAGQGRPASRPVAARSAVPEMIDRPIQVPPPRPLAANPAPDTAAPVAAAPAVTAPVAVSVKPQPAKAVSAKPVPAKPAAAKKGSGNNGNGPSGVSSSERRRISLRLDDPAYLKLKVISARNRRSMQDLLTEALSRMVEEDGLDAGPGCPFCAKED